MRESELVRPSELEQVKTALAAVIERLAKHLIA